MNGKFKPGLGLTDMKKNEWIYDMVNGSLIGDALMLPKEDLIVTSEFKEGMYCYQQYEKVFHAKLRIEELLLSDEDEDTELIINNMNDIIRYLSMNVYDNAKSGAPKGKLSRAFDNDPYCREKYMEILAAKANLELRLATGSQPDVEIMIDGMDNIMKHVVLKMYEYGKMAAKRNRAG